MSDDLRGGLPALLERESPAPKVDADLSMLEPGSQPHAGLIVTTVAVVVALLAVLPSVIDAGSQRLYRTMIDDVDDDRAPTEVAAFPCPPADEARALVAPRRELPGGAVLARICPTGDVPWTPPVDPLAIGLDELIVEVNVADPLGRGVACPDALAREFVLTFKYPDGHTSDIRGGLACDLIVAGGEQRTGAQALVGRYAALLSRQRAGLEAPGAAGADPSCPVRSQVGVDEWRTILDDGYGPVISRGVLCVYGDGPVAREVALTPEQAGVLGSGYVSAAGTPRGPCGADPQLVVLRGVNEWGDRIELVGRCDGFSYEGATWRPSSEAAALLDTLLR